MKNCLLGQQRSGLTKTDLEMLSQVARTAAHKGGEILMKHYGNLSNIKNKVTQGDQVTEADLESESIIIKYLKRT